MGTTTAAHLADMPRDASASGAKKSSALAAGLVSTPASTTINALSLGMPLMGNRPNPPTASWSAVGWWSAMASREVRVRLENVAGVKQRIEQLEAERDAARATLAKAYEHAAHQAGVTSFATAKAWKRQMDLLKEGGDV